MSERRKADRPGASDRRDFPRPPLWLNLLLLVIAIAFAFGARTHRGALDRRYEQMLNADESAPIAVNRVKSELSAMDLSEEALAKELDGRMKHLASIKSDKFYISIDTTKRKFYFNYGDHVLREAPVEVGPPRTFELAQGSITFLPLKGAFAVKEKLINLDWRVPTWVYVMNKQPIPKTLPVVPNGLGAYVIVLPNNYVIHSGPAPDSPLQGPKPGSFLVPEADLKAIWSRVDPKTNVFIF